VFFGLCAHVITELARDKAGAKLQLIEHLAAERVALGMADDGFAAGGELRAVGKAGGRRMSSARSLPKDEIQVFP
jgi:phage gp36-like protein